jgi:hypothetical protein
VESDVERQRKLIVSDAEQRLGEIEMGSGGDRHEFGETLDDAENQGNQN